MEFYICFILCYVSDQDMDRESSSNIVSGINHISLVNRYGKRCNGL